MIRFLLALTVVVVNLPMSYAQETTQVNEAREAEISQVAKKRLYPGGRDEEDLRVQAELVTPSRKMAPQAEVKEETSEE